MSDADACIKALDSALAANGEIVVLRRVVGQGNATANIDVSCPALVRTYRLREDQIVAGIDQAMLLVSISPTPIANAQWPGGVIPGQSVDPSIPRRNDSLIIAGRLRNIDAVERLAMGGQVVRYDLQVLG